MAISTHRSFADHASPVAYGSPSDMARLYTTVAEVSDREPGRTFEDPEVQEAAQHLLARLQARLAPLSAVEGPHEMEVGA